MIFSLIKTASALIVLISALSCQANVKSLNLEKDENLLNKVQLIANKQNQSVLTTKNVYKLSNGDGVTVTDQTTPLLISELETYFVLYTKNKELEQISKLGKKNELTFLKTLAIEKKEKIEQSSSKLDVGGDSLKYISQLFKRMCHVKLVWNVKQDSKIILQSHEGATRLDLCKLATWGFAAHNIAFKQSDKPNEIILVDAADIR